MSVQSEQISFSELQELNVCRFARDFRWSETGDKYIVKLFRDHVFHSVDESGRPVLSLTHVLTNLNKVSTFRSFSRQPLDENTAGQRFR
jgi:hypothetical protein